MGWVFLSKPFSMAATEGGSFDFSANSRDRARTCDVEGTLPVRRSQNMDSGSISVPDVPLGSSFWQSVMVRPWKRIPSSASRTLPSQTIDLRVRMPPMTWETVTSPILVSPFALTCFKSSRFSGMISRRVVFRSGSAEEERRRHWGEAYVRVEEVRTARKACVETLGDIFAIVRQFCDKQRQLKSPAGMLMGRHRFGCSR